jgi:hypothetical protein
MRFLSKGKTTMGNYTVPMKIALTSYVLFMLVGLATSIALYHNQFDFSADDASTYYRGNQGQENVQTFHVAKSYRELLETTHFHIYIMPVVYLAFVHLYFLSAQPQWEKVLMSLATFLGLGAEVAAPWLVRYYGGAWADLFWFSGLAITIPTIWMALICLFELWWPPSWSFGSS